MRTHETQQIIIAFTAIVFAWSIACLLTIAFGGPLPSETFASTDRPVGVRNGFVSRRFSAADRFMLPCWQERLAALRHAVP
jgi:hypothetical protein